MKLKRILLIGLLFVLVAGCGKNENETIKIGAILPLTGSAAQWGTPCKNASMIAVDEINSEGGINGKKIEITFEDTQAEPAKGVSAIQKLIDTEKPVAILGAVASSVSLAIAPIAEKNKVVVISPASTSPKLTDAGDYFFRVIPTDKLRSEVFANYIFNKGIKTLDIVYINNEGGVGAVTAFVNEYNRLGGKILVQEGYTPSVKDFKTQLTKSKRSKSEAIMIVSYPEDTALLLRQIKELNVNKKVFALTEALDDPAVVQDAGGAAEGVEYIVPAPAEGEVADKFANEYKAKYGVAPPTFAAESYDVIYLLKKVILGLKDVTSENIKNALYNVKDFNGASGKITFDKKGDVIKPMAIKIVKNDKNIVNDSL